MAAVSEPGRSRNGRRLPDLPTGMFDDDEDFYAPEPSPPPVAARPAPKVRSIPRDVPVVAPVRSRSTAEPATSPEPGVALRPRSQPRARHVFPSGRDVIDQAFPCALMAVSIAVVWLLGRHTPFGVPVWAAGVFIPTVLLAWTSSTSVRQPMQRAALINLATMAIVFPVLVVRQSVVRIPFVGSENGTLLPPFIATVSVVVLLTAIAIATAILTQEDPEFAGIVFLPAALMVPALAGQSSLVSLSSGLLVAMAVFILAALLTMAASMVPPIVAILIAPVAIALEFLVLTIIRSTSTFPVGASGTAKVLFFTIVVTTVALAIAVPFLSTWERQVTRLARAAPMA